MPAPPEYDHGIPTAPGNTPMAPPMGVPPPMAPPHNQYRNDVGLRPGGFIPQAPY